ncbi:MAG: DUF4350 domain-containing protein [Pseudoxanthomonas sp.]
MKPMGKALRIALIAMLGLALVGAGVAWFLHNYQRVEKQINLPPRGEAGYNPLYALKKALQADGLQVQSRQRLNLSTQRLAQRDTLLILNDPRSMTPMESQALLEWVAGGGHLVVRTPSIQGWQEKGGAALFDALALRLVEASAECEPMQVEAQDPHVEFCRGRRFTFVGVEPELSWGDLKAGYVYARLAHGDGHVDVLADFDFLSNDGGAYDMPTPGTAGGTQTGGLRDGPHRALARQVLAPNYGHGTMHLVYAAQLPSLLRSVLTRGWPVWVPLLLALLAWLWRRMQRFGPQRPSPVGARRSLLEHVRASGEHLFRYNRRALLYAAVRKSFLARLRRRDPVAAALSGEPQVTAIAARVGLRVELVRSALQAPSSHDKPAFRNRISTLIQLRNRL